MIFKEQDGSYCWDDDSHEAVLAALAEIHEAMDFEGMSDDEINHAVRAWLETKRKGLLN